MSECSPIVFTELDQSQQPLADVAEALCAEQFNQSLNWNDGYRVFAAVEGDTLLGVANVLVGADRSANVRYIVVNPEERGRGIGSVLLANTLDELEAVGCEQVSSLPLSTRNDRFFERHGFTYYNPHILNMTKTLKAAQ